MAEQDVVPAVAVEVADAGDLPGEVRRQAGPAAGERAAAVHAVVVPAAVLVAEQDVVPAVAVEVAEVAQVASPKHWFAALVAAGLEPQAKRIAAGGVPVGRDLNIVGARTQRAPDAKVRVLAGIVIGRELVAGGVV